MPKAQKLLLQYLAKIYDTGEDEIAQLIFKKGEDGKTLTDEVSEDALETLTARDASRVAELSTDKTKIFDEAYNKALDKVSTKLEKSLAKRLGVEYKKDETKFDDLLENIKPGGSGSKGTLTEDAVKAHPLFVQLEQQVQTQKETFEAQLEEKLNEAKQGFDNERTLLTVKETGLSLFEGLNPVLSETSKVAANQRKAFAKMLEQHNYQPTEDGKDYILLDADGKSVKDAHGNVKTLSKFVPELAAQHYDFKAQEDKGGPGNQGGSGGGSITVPKTEEEYTERFYELSGDPDAQIELADAWEASQGGN